MGLEIFKDTQGKKQEHKGENFQKQMTRSLDGAERKTCNESMDIRDTGIKGDPFAPSGRKVVDRIIKSSEKPSVSQDANLHSDTTRPGDNTVTGMKKGGFTESAEKGFAKQKDKRVLDATKRRVLNS